MFTRPRPGLLPLRDEPRTVVSNLEAELAVAVRAICTEVASGRVLGHVLESLHAAEIGGGLNVVGIAVAAIHAELRGDRGQESGSAKRGREAAVFEHGGIHAGGQRS